MAKKKTPTVYELTLPEGMNIKDIAPKTPMVVNTLEDNTAMNTTIQEVSTDIQEVTEVTTDTTEQDHILTPLNSDVPLDLLESQEKENTDMNTTINTVTQEVNTDTISNQTTKTPWIDQVLLCSVNIGKWGNNKQLTNKQSIDLLPSISDQLNKKRARINKTLLELSELTAIVTHDAKANKWFLDHSVPSPLKKGIYAVPYTFIDEWNAYLNKYISDRDVLVQSFLEEYDMAITQAAIDLGPLFNPLDYPSREEMFYKFHVGVQYLDISLPTKLQVINPKLFQEAKDKMEQTIKDGQSAIEHMLCEEVLAFVKQLHDTLQGYDDGVQKRLQDRFLEKIQAYCETFNKVRNVTGFDELSKVVEQLGSIAVSYDRNTLKLLPKIRSEVKTSLESSMVALKGMMSARPKRLIDLDD